MSMMFAVWVTPLVRRCQPFGLIAINRHLSLKYLREKQLKKESKLQSIQELVLKKNMEMNGEIDWNRLTVDLFDQKLVYKQNFEMDLMAAFLLNNGTDCQKVDQKLFKSMISFIRFLPNIADNSIASSRFCHFLSHFNHFMDYSDIQLIRQTTDQMMQKYINSQTTYPVINDCITGLAQSSPDNCLHSIQLLDSLKTTDYNLITHIINSCIKFKLFEQSFDLIKRFPQIKFDNQLICQIIHSLSDCQLNCDQILNILRILSKNVIVFDTKLKDIFNQMFEKFSFKRFETSIESKGLCLKCNQTLKGLSVEEQNLLVKEFRSIVFNKQNDTLMASLPEYEKEMKIFDKFMIKLTANRPLGLVIDGLNIAYATYSDVVEDKNNLRQFVRIFSKENIDQNAVDILLQNNVFNNYNNILIVGRNHMKGWKRLNQLLWTHRQRVSMFYAMNKTQDDCYMLYAALQHHNTLLISSDLYRDYIAKLDTKSSLFERWLRTHQIHIKDRKYLQYPDQFDHTIHISADNRLIHIPFRKDQESNIEWICYQRI